RRPLRHALRGGKQRSSSFGQGNALILAHKERLSECVLHLRNSPAQRGLTHLEASRGAAQAPGLAHGKKNPEVIPLQVHVIPHAQPHAAMHFRMATSEFWQLLFYCIARKMGKEGIRNAIMLRQLRLFFIAAFITAALSACAQTSAQTTPASLGKP